MKMTDYGFVPNKLQDALVANPSRRSPLVLKMVVLVAAMTGSVCICSVFLKQMEEPIQPRIKRANLTEKALVHVDLIEKNPPDLSIEEKNLPVLTRVDLTEQNLSFVVSPNSAEVNFPHLVRVNTSVLTLPPALKVNETPFLDPKQSESLLHDFSYNNTKTYTRVESGCMHASLYVIVSIQRSGSKWFEALLNSHDNIWSHGEIFYSVDRKCNMTVIKKVLDKVYSRNWNTTSSFRRKKRSCMAAVGFKWMLNQGILDNHEGIVDYINHRGVSVILLLRRNHLRRLVSLKSNNHDGKVKGLNGTHKAHVNSKQEAEILASYKPKLDVKRLIPALEHMEMLAADTLRNFSGTRHMVVYYEDLVQNQTQTMKDVLDFLKVPQRTLTSGHVKIHTRPLAQQIKNWRAVAKVINRTKYRRFITANDYEI